MRILASSRDSVNSGMHKGKEACMEDQIHVLCAELSDAQQQRLEAVSPRVVVHNVASSPEINAALGPDTEIVFASKRDLPIEQAGRLRWVQVESAGVDYLIDTPLWHSDITITSANGVHAVQIPEYVLAMLLAHGHHLPAMQRAQAEHSWADRAARERLQPRELRDGTLGIIGYGAIGREVARLAHAFGMRILATARTPDGPHPYDGWTPRGTGDADGSLPEQFFALDQLPDMLRQCDAVVLAIPLSERTRHLLNADTLAALPSHALVINIGRGGLIDHVALIDALRNERIGSAALDVTDPEPLPPDSPLWDMPNVLITPHISGMSPHYTDRAVDLFVENLRRYVANEPLLNVVDRKRGY
jgi:phosphoglycerate dehydrogenase-like enzyme